MGRRVGFCVWLCCSFTVIWTNDHSLSLGLGLLVYKTSRLGSDPLAQVCDSYTADRPVGPASVIQGNQGSGPATPPNLTQRRN